MSPDELATTLLLDPAQVCSRIFRNEQGSALVLTSYQTEELKKLLYSLMNDEPGRFVFVQSTRSGKSELISIFIALALLLRPNVKIANISYIESQAAVIFERVKSHLVYDSDWTRQLVNIGASMVSRREFSKTRFFMQNGSQFRIFSTGKGETELTAEGLLGFGADILILDEAASIRDEIYRTKILRMLTDARSPKFLLISGTPHRKNFMFNAWNDPTFERFHVDCWMAVKEGQMSEEEVNRAKEEMSDFEFRVWYLSEFPEDDEDQLIKTSWIENAQRDYMPIGKPTRVALGIDVARHGKDLTVFTLIEWYSSLAYIRKTWSLSNRSTMETVGKAQEILEEYPNIESFIVDDDGVGGGVVDRLKELSLFDSKVKPFINGSSPHRKEEKYRDLTSQEELDNSRFLNKRAFYFSRLARLFEKGNIVIPENKALVEQLSSLRVRIDSDKKVRILDEKDSGKSPDYADSLMMACSDLGISGFHWGFV